MTTELQHVTTNTSADYAEKREEAKRDVRRYQVQAGNNACIHVGWFYTSIEAAEFRSLTLSMLSELGAPVTVNEVNYNWFERDRD